MTLFIIVIHLFIMWYVLADITHKIRNEFLYPA
jgi:hypothetical protein